MHGIEEEVQAFLANEPSTQYERIKNIVERARGKNLFADIKDPSEWQREIRKEWDRDL